MYNLKITDYGDEKQISFYPRGVKTSIKHDMTKAEREEYDKKRKLFLFDKYFRDDMLALSDVVLNDNNFHEVDLEKERIKYVETHVDYFKQSARTSSADFETRDKLNQNRSIIRTKQSIYNLTRANEWNYFATFTFSDNDYRYDYDLCKSKFRAWMHNFKNRCVDVEYLAVAEQHKDGAWHFHALIQGDLSEKLVRGVRNNTFTLPQYNYGINEFEKVRDRYRVSNYITKYITKSFLSKIRNKQRFLYSRGLNKPVTSEHVISDVYTLCDFIQNNYPDYTMTYQKTVEFAESYIQYIQIRKFADDVQSEQ